MQRMSDCGSIDMPVVVDIRTCPDTINTIDGTQIHYYYVACKAVNGNIGFFTPEFTKRVIVDCALLKIQVVADCERDQSDSCMRQIRLLNSMAQIQGSQQDRNRWTVEYSVNGVRMPRTNQMARNSNATGPSLDDLSIDGDDALRRLLVYIDSVRSGMPRYWVHMPAMSTYEAALSGMVFARTKGVARRHVGLFLDSLRRRLELNETQDQLLAALSLQMQLGWYQVTDQRYNELYDQQKNVDSSTTYARRLLPALRRLQSFAHSSSDGEVVLTSIRSMLDELNSNADTIHVYFWATWCSNCFAQMDHVKQFADSVRQRGHEVICFAIQSAEDAYETAKHRLPRHSRLLHQFEDATLNAALSRGFCVYGVPRLLTISRDGMYYNPKVQYVP